MDGIILFDKPQGWTSQDVCTKLKHLLNLKKIGHCGTLDPFATGLLIILINNGTKIGQFIESFDKTYIARLKLGEKTDSADVDGKVIQTMPIPNLTKQDILLTFNRLIGKQKQLPPMYSAIKVEGKPLYQYAREGKQVKRKEKDIEIFDLRLIDFDGQTITFLAHVSKGTYIRTLGETIAEKLNCVGHLLNLQRTKVGHYLLNHASNFETVCPDSIIPFNRCLNFFKHVVVNEHIEKDIKNGKRLFLNESEEKIAIFNKDDKLLAIYEKVSDGLYKSLRGFFNEDL